MESSDGTAKFRIEDEVILIENKGLKARHLKLAKSILEENKEYFIEEWRNIFG